MLHRYQRTTAQLLRLDLGTPTGGSGLTAVDVLIVQLEDDDARVGLGFSYVLGNGGSAMLAAARDLLDTFVDEKDIVPPQALWRRLTAALNRSGRGVSYLAIAAIGVAAWDLHAKALELPLGEAMGGELRSLPVCGSATFPPEDRKVQQAARNPV